MKPLTTVSVKNWLTCHTRLFITVILGCWLVCFLIGFGECSGWGNLGVHIIGGVRLALGHCYRSGFALPVYVDWLAADCSHMTQVCGCNDSCF